jgi:hypothetical protein
MASKRSVMGWVVVLVILTLPLGAYGTCYLLRGQPGEAVLNDVDTIVRWFPSEAETKIFLPAASVESVITGKQVKLGIRLR